MTKITLPIVILIMLVISPLFFSVTELNGDDERVLVSDLQIFQQVDCITTPNINCRIDREVYEGLTYREIFEDNNIDRNYSQIFRGSFLNDNQIVNDVNETRSRVNLRPNSILEITNNHYQAIYVSDISNKNVDEIMFYSPRYFTNKNDEGIISRIMDESDFFGIEIYYADMTIETIITIDTYKMIDLSIFTTEPTQQQLDQWLKFYLQHKDQGIINDFYHIQSDTLINMSLQAYNGIDNLIVRTNNFIDWLTLDVASLLSRSIGFLGDKTYEILDDVGIISNDFTWWADFNDSLPTWLKRLVGLE